MITRRGLIGVGAGLLVAGCDRVNDLPQVREGLAGLGGVHQRVQRLLGRHALAREYGTGQMSPQFRANGNTEAGDPAWRQHLAEGFSRWALQVGGLVHRPLALPLSALQAMPQRTQITRHDCVEGWSAIGKWQGPQLGPILATAGLMPAARYVVLHCADDFSGTPYYESIDLVDAFHPQTILAWRMNDAPLEAQHGAPVRLRVERQLGYKQAKYVMRVEVRDSLTGLYGGKGGYWEDVAGYQWYAGI
ncbi:MAG: molybdopterin-dependent oxidoreductase [Sphingomonadales bacterium]|nr:molybdopterin-dependent oxidoreductase [Sphingomonadales bacterium]